jgi:GTPase SAR1 family protein
MGNLQFKKKSTGLDPASKEIDRALQKDVEKDVKIIKLLLLGAGESGKSTLFKQAIKLYGEGFDEQALLDYGRGIMENSMSGMSTLCRESETRGGEFAVSEDAKDALRFFREVEGKTDNGDTVDVTDEAAENIKILWKEEGIQKLWTLRSEFQIPDSVSFFFDDIDRLAEPDYIPTHTDILRCRARTTGIVETQFSMNNTHFRIMDVGGQRSERKKWIHCFEDVMAVLFVAAINEYDQKCFEDGATNRVTEALDLFDQVCNQGWFKKASIILFLNKRDLFEEKIKRVDLNTLFPDYTGGHDYDKGVTYLKEKFASCNTTEGIELYTHVTCATDVKNVQFTFDAVKMIVLNNSLDDSGLQ